MGPACGILSGPSSNALLLLSDTSPGFYHLLPLIPSLPPPHFLWATPDWSACGILSGLPPGSLIFPHLPPSSPSFNFFHLSHLLTRWNFCFLNAPVASFAWRNIARTILYSFLYLYLALPLSLFSSIHPLSLFPLSLRPTQRILPLYDSRTMS